MNNRHLVVDAEHCTGCNSCVLTCSVMHEGLFSNVGSRIRIDRNGEQSVFRPRVCVQCQEAPCIGSCPLGALSRVETGAIRLDQEACSGCEACVSACPYDGVFFDARAQVPIICDLCGGQPECVQFCRLAQAIRYEPSS